MSEWDGGQIIDVEINSFVPESGEQWREVWRLEKMGFKKKKHSESGWLEANEHQAVMNWNWIEIIYICNKE